MLKNKEYYLASWSPVGGSTVYLGLKALNIDTCLKQFVNGQISCYKTICKWTNFLLYAIRFIQLYLNYNLPRFKRTKGGHLGPKDLVKASGFYCNRLKIKHSKKCLKMFTIFHTRSLHYKHLILSVAY